jgi:glycosyltransferase involved in cell wall biosynthesis
MRIAYLSTFYPFRGGIAQFNTSLLRELQNQHEVTAFTFKRQYPEIFFPGKTQYVAKNENGNPVHGEQLLDSINPFSFLKTASRIKEFNPDVLIMKYWMSFFGPSLGATVKLLPKNVKVITILDNVISREKRFFDKAFTKFFLEQNDGFVAMSESVVNDLLTLKPGAKFIKMEHPLYDHFGETINREDACLRLNIAPDKKTLLFFGFIRDYKGLDILIKAFNLLDDSYQLVIAGETYGSFKRYQSLIELNRNKDRIYVFNDYVNDIKVPELFSAADVCMLPYKHTSQSGIAALAYHFDLPLIATDVGGLKESISGKGTGIIVKECQSELIAQAVEDYFNKKLSAHFISNIKNLKEELSWKKFGESLMQFSQKL